MGGWTEVNHRTALEEGTSEPIGRGEGKESDRGKPLHGTDVVQRAQPRGSKWVNRISTHTNAWAGNT